jgi:hypothetical protein
VLIVASLLFAVATSAQAKPPAKKPAMKATAAAASTATPAATATVVSQIETDAIVAAAQKAMQMHDTAAGACNEGLEKQAHGGPLAQAQRHLLRAAAVLYNSANQLKRIGQKELAQAEKWQASGEQKERAASAAENDAEKAAVTRKGKAQLAYGETQGAIAESLIAFAKREEELAKEADAAAQGTDSAAFEAAAKKIIEENKAAKALYESVKETRT